MSELWQAAVLRWLLRVGPGLAVSATVGAVAGGVTAAIVSDDNGGGGGAKVAVATPSAKTDAPGGPIVTPDDGANPPRPTDADGDHPASKGAEPKIKPKKPAPRGPSRMDQCLASERQCTNVCGDLGFSCRNDCGSTSECKARCDPQETQCKRGCEATRARCVNP